MLLLASSISSQLAEEFWHSAAWLQAHTSILVLKSCRFHIVSMSFLLSGCLNTYTLTGCLVALPGTLAVKRSVWDNC